MTKVQIPAEAVSIPATRLAASGARPAGAVSRHRVLPLLSLLLVLLTGCARNYVITMSNGSRITTKGKPKLQNGSYVFKDASGQPARVSAGRVREIAPASMATVEGSQFMK